MSAGGDRLSRMRPAIKAGLLMVWRDPDTLQIGIDPRRAIALRGMRGAQTLINLLDGSRDLGQVLAAAHELGISRQSAERVIGLLAAAGALHDFPAATMRALPAGPRDRLARELATVSLAHGHTDGGALVLARRQAASVRVHGTGLVASGLASLLTESGVGRVSCTGAAAEPPSTGPQLSSWPPTGRVRLGHPAADGHPAAAGRPGADARPGAGRGTRGTRGPGCRPDLAVLVDGYLPELPGSLVAAGVVHLTAAASEAIGVVGPLVIPGQTACLSCVDMARTDRDPAWPLILAQVCGQAPQPAACAAVLAAAVAAQATAQALAFLDRAGPATAVINGTLELVLPGWQWRRHSWIPHRQCRCSRRPAS
jgi:bacteriocin biosynthesis cyclodehydratase domain-containing protein